MKQQKKPTRAQRKLIQQWGLHPENWYVVKDTSWEMELVNRYSDKTVKVIPKVVAKNERTRN